MSFSVAFDVAAAVAISALLAEVYGLVRRKMAGAWITPYLLGVVFGLLALVQMNNPIEPFEGLIIDCRNIPIALAGAFLGWRGLLPCLVMAMAMRISVGGVGMESALWAMAISGAAGLIWARQMAKSVTRGFGSFIVLAVAMSVHLVAAFFLPHEIAVWFFTTAALPILGLNLTVIPIVAALLERENRRIRKENWMTASARHDAASGLLLGPAFIREVANALTARQIGTFAGFLTITPERSLLSAVTGLFGDPAPAALDRQALAVHLKNADLAGLCADGRILVPLSLEEVYCFSRVKANLKVAISDSPSAANGTVVTLSMREVCDPAEFLRIAETAAARANVDWNAEAAARKKPVLSQNEAGALRQEKIFDPEKHDILFAKADFLMLRKKKYAP